MMPLIALLLLVLFCLLIGSPYAGENAMSYRWRLTLWIIMMSIAIIMCIMAFSSIDTYEPPPEEESCAEIIEDLHLEGEITIVEAIAMHKMNMKVLLSELEAATMRKMLINRPEVLMVLEVSPCAGDEPINP